MQRVRTQLDRSHVLVTWVTLEMGHSAVTTMSVLLTLTTATQMQDVQTIQARSHVPVTWATLEMGHSVVTTMSAP